MIDEIDWPKLARDSVKGKGLCLGATHGNQGPYVTTMTDKQEELAKTINNCLSPILSHLGIKW